MRDYLGEAEEHRARSKAAPSYEIETVEQRAAQTVAAIGSLEALHRIAAALENISARAFPPAAPAPFVAPGPVTCSVDEQAGKHAAREIWGILGGPEGVL